ncbi:hypothetical protein WR164_03290 [Philodulcilactobacillus myokoensis]|uniref:Uncharacterized protein n=1 Tax=Philodulcilactobacillus myokoensis TaxID=2929573 RepID=A0A9W6B0L9_9LACO|nr:hypothetical protein [Philodulcilactobacillus myokoensis]GLB46350.1 hypothetical protein WR164_03290 [Philodulcilactobacillus myokoensis]
MKKFNVKKLSKKIVLGAAGVALFAPMVIGSIQAHADMSLPSQAEIDKENKESAANDKAAEAWGKKHAHYTGEDDSGHDVDINSSGDIKGAYDHSDTNSTPTVHHHAKKHAVKKHVSRKRKARKSKRHTRRLSRAQKNAQRLNKLARYLKKWQKKDIHKLTRKPNRLHSKRSKKALRRVAKYTHNKSLHNQLNLIINQL